MGGSSAGGHQHYPNLGTSTMPASRPQSNSFSGSFGGNTSSTANNRSSGGNRGSTSASTSNGGGSNQDAAVRTCVEMGFSASRARQVLEAVGWDVMKAVAVLADDGPGGGGGSSSSGGGSTSGSRSRSPSSVAPPGKKELRFKIPANVKPGMTVTIADGSSGKRHSVRVPANAKPGTELRIFVDK